MKTSTPQSSTKTPRLILFGVLFVILVCLFCKSFLPQWIIFSNDGSYAVQKMQWTHLPESFLGSWYDQNTIGVNAGAVVPNFTQAFRWAFGALGYSKFIAPIALWFFGAAAFFFFRRAGLSSLAAVLGGIGACLTTSYFSNVCWGSVPPTIAFGLDLLAMGALIKRDNLPVWLAPALAGLAVGMNVVEAADIGALLSLVVAAFALFQALAEDGTPLAQRVVRGIWRTAVVSIFAGFIAAYAVSVLITANITGIAGTKQDEATKQQNYDFATQWSVPKKETLALVVPNLFGCNVIAPAPANYWGSDGTDPSWDRYFAGTGPLPSPQAYLRHTGRGIYIGAMIVFLACCAGVQSLRKKDSGFTDLERRHIWFWWAVTLVALPLAWGRHAPFFQIVYHLPYFSTIRSPDKFLYIVTLAMVILFGYGIHGLSRRYLDVPLAPASGGRFKSWWAKASMYERRCVVGLIGVVLLSALGWCVYAAMRGHVEDYLVTWQKLDLLRSGRELQGKGLAAAQDSASAQVTFSLKQAGWFVVIIGATVGMVLAIMSGTFAGRRARWAGVLLGVILIGDLVRADLPYIHWWDYKEKYEVGNPEPVIKFLADKPYEHRVAYALPLATPDAFGQFKQLYDYEWTQQLFPVYNIPTLDIVQMPRMPEDLKTFNEAMRVQFKTNDHGGLLLDQDGHPGMDDATMYRIGRLWQLSATRYLVGPLPLINLMNQQFDSVSNHFRIIQPFDLGPREGIDPRDVFQYSQIAAVPTNSPNALYALFEDTAALPRATLFSNWEIVTNDEAALARLTERSFDPMRAVLLTKPLPVQQTKPYNGDGTNPDLAAVKITSYAPATIHLEAAPTKPSVLMMADKYDPDWQVFVDGKRGEVLKCNYLMHGVYLEPGKHEVEFRFRPNIHMFYENLIAIAIACCLLGYAMVTIRKRGNGPNEPK
jgi:hypothetical protein